MSELSSTAAPPAEPGPATPSQGTGVMAWNQPGFAGMWGLATAKDSLKYWFKQKSFGTFVLTRWAFGLFFFALALNGFVVFNRVVMGGEAEEIRSYPIVTLMLLAFVLATTKERSKGIYFWAAWIFWITFNLVGFVNATKITQENMRFIFPGMFKTWICLIAVPWMTFRVVSPDKLPRYTKILVLSAVLGSIMCMVQTIDPIFFSYIRMTNTVRGAGVWQNANMAGFVLMMALLLSRLVTWRTVWLRWGVYIILLIGLILTLSRGALVSYVIGEMTYLLIVQNYRRMLVGGLLLSLFLAAWVMAGMLVKSNAIKVDNAEVRYRVQSLSSLFSGEVSAGEIREGRGQFWVAAINDTIKSGDILFGMGHLGMVRSSIGYAPHNEYVYFFAEGGLVNLFNYLSFMGIITYTFWKCKDQSIRAVLLSIMVAFLFFGMTSDKNFSYQMTAPYWAILVMWSHYSREYPGVEKVQRMKRALARTLAIPAHAPVANPG